MNNQKRIVKGQRFLTIEGTVYLYTLYADGNITKARHEEGWIYDESTISEGSTDKEQQIITDLRSEYEKEESGLSSSQLR